MSVNTFTFEKKGVNKVVLNILKFPQGKHGFRFKTEGESFTIAVGLGLEGVSEAVVTTTGDVYQSTTFGREESSVNKGCDSLCTKLRFIIPQMQHANLGDLEATKIIYAAMKSTLENNYNHLSCTCFDKLKKDLNELIERPFNNFSCYFDFIKGGVAEIVIDLTNIPSGSVQLDIHLERDLFMNRILTETTAPFYMKMNFYLETKTRLVMMPTSF